MLNNGRVFAAKRKAGKHLEGFWEFPGGKIEEGETPETCLARELKEELGIKVTVGNIFSENTHDYGSKLVKLIAYRVTIDGGEIQLTDHDEFRWLDPSELMSVQWAPADIPFVDKLRDEIT